MMCFVVMTLLLFAVFPGAAAGATGPGDDTGVYSVQHFFIQSQSGKDRHTFVRYPEGMIMLTQRGTENPPPRIVGGPCQYKSYPGRAEIVSVRKVEAGQVQGALPYEPFEVKFSFRADGKVEEPHARVESKEHLLTLINSFYPGPKFLQKYGIKVGQVFDCNLMVILQGTCTPVVFEFPAIDLGDYFELQDAPPKPVTR
jgi:hypothetical protein